MIEIDASDDGSDGRDDIRGVETAAEADFEYAEFDAGARETFESHGGDAFEICGMGTELASGEEFFDQDVNAGESFGEDFVTNLLAIDADALVDSFQMGRSVETGAQAGMAEDRFEERGRRAFAVRAGDMDAGIGTIGAAEALRKDSNVLKVELCGGDLCRRSQFPAEGEQIADRGLVIHAQDSLEEEKAKTDASRHRPRPG